MFQFFAKMFSHVPAINAKTESPIELLPIEIIIEITKYFCLKDATNFCLVLNVSQEIAVRYFNFHYNEKIVCLNDLPLEECDYIHLLKNKLFQEQSTDLDKFSLALRIRHLDLITKYLHGSQVHASELLILSAIHGLKDVIQILVQEFNVDPSYQDNQAIKWAAQCGHEAVVKFLLEDFRVNPYKDYNHGIIWASQCGYKYLVKFLLKDLSINPGIDNNQAIIEAVWFNQLEIVKLLLDDSRINPADQSNQALIFAAQNGNLEIVKLLIKHPKVDISARDNIAIKSAIHNGHEQVVDLLISDCRNNDSIWKIPRVKEVLLNRCCNRNI